ncbi:hypothetical protein [Hymenobacter weizhouensis]|uniref:hypothetical protein n=1 Tax=Hymenobacter sp. YIM 151500-1 TaxID=2987689 RepID=UPI0022267571|nr:hypothetical protein [Hymenobacter sp. YIM 151500-1]UYZ63265.1 hypothetical protein OIS53_00110 [Hymenobacter sp. YIM 151500-1]
MKKHWHYFFFLFLAFITLSSCEKEEPDLEDAPRTNIIFNDNIDLGAADFRLNTPVTLKITLQGEQPTSLKVVSRYLVGSTVRLVDVATLPVSNGTATLNVPASALRNTADGPVVGAGTNPNSSRSANTYTLLVQATLADGRVEQRTFTAVVVR